MRSSSGFLLNLDIDRTGCRRSQGLVSLCVGLALAGIAYGGLPEWLNVPAVLLVLGCGLRGLRRVSPRSPGYVACIRIRPDGQFLAGSTTDPATLASVDLVRSWLLPGMAVGLTFAGERKQWAEAILFCDRLAPAVWRRLVVRLRHTGRRDR